ncbi:hypothetical protein HMPREF1016_00355 [Bacteroides eggerthii 1_2_48FAA]|uniref:Uncharacterized protein n=1 Tax=Bacteroides eggerthii 1_2_48FAA TaxID=665953 RepID=E5WUK3_9BACE|nr:hypothetical protein HMPREF1016_00355 [Bacteroides eggerthii 1_2_48FAA]
MQIGWQSGILSCLPVCRQAGMLAGGQGCLPDGRKACRPFRLQRKGIFAKVVSLRRCVAAFGADVVACGVIHPPLPPPSL